MNTITKKNNFNKLFPIISIILLNIYLLFFTPCSPINGYTTFLGDTTVYLNVGKEILNGRIMYTEIFDHKGPLLPFIFTIPHLFGNVGLTFFTMILILQNIIFYLNYKTIKLNNTNNALTLILLSLQLLIISQNPLFLFSPETLALLSISYINYWILSGKYKNPTNTQLIICGILTAMMFWIKFTYITYIGMIFLFFLYTKIKEKSFNYKDILMPAIGFLIITIPLIIYLVANNALIEMFNIYVSLNASYKNHLSLKIDYKFILLIISILSYFIYGIKTKKIENIAFSIAYTVLIIFVFLMPKNNWMNLYFPFIGLLSIFPHINIDFNKKILKLSTNTLSTVLLIGMLLNSYTYSYNYNTMKKNNFLENYTSIEQYIEPNSKITTLYLQGTSITEAIKSFNYKYFYFPLFTYSQFPEIFDTVHNDIKNKELDYVIIEKNKETNDKTKIAIIHERFTPTEYDRNKIDEINKDLCENYEEIKDFEQYTLFKAKK